MFRDITALVVSAIAVLATFGSVCVCVCMYACACASGSLVRSICINVTYTSVQAFKYICLYACAVDMVLSYVQEEDMMRKDGSLWHTLSLHLFLVPLAGPARKTPASAHQLWGTLESSDLSNQLQIYLIYIYIDLKFARPC